MAAGPWCETAVITRKRENKHESLLAASTDKSNLSGGRKALCTHPTERNAAYPQDSGLLWELLTNLPAPVILQTSLINTLSHNNKVLSPCGKDTMSAPHIRTGGKMSGNSYCGATSAFNPIS